MVGVAGYRPSRSNRRRGIGGNSRRLPYISNTRDTPNSSRKDPIFCKLCGHGMSKIESFHALMCNNCGNLDDLPLTEQEIRAQQQQESTFSIADGSIIYNQDTYSSDNLRHRKHYVSPGGITRKMPSVEDRLRDSQKSIGERAMDEESALLTREAGIKITSREDIIRQSAHDNNNDSTILDRDSLVASKGGNDDVDIHSIGGPKHVKRRFS